MDAKATKKNITDIATVPTLLTTMERLATDLYPIGIADNEQPDIMKQ